MKVSLLFVQNKRTNKTLKIIKLIKSASKFKSITSQGYKALQDNSRMNVQRQVWQEQPFLKVVPLPRIWKFHLDFQVVCMHQKYNYLQLLNANHQTSKITWTLVKESLNTSSNLFHHKQKEKIKGNPENFSEKANKSNSFQISKWIHRILFFRIFATWTSRAAILNLMIKRSRQTHHHQRKPVPKYLVSIMAQ